jgi:uncharacterized protein (TIGR02646 family)
MKHIIKKIGNQPNSFRDYSNTPNATYAGYVDNDPHTGRQGVLKEGLAEEQGWICCYCMMPLIIGSITVEHYITQKWHKASPHSTEEHKNNQLVYQNLLASCNYQNGRKCSEQRGNAPLRHIDPRRKASSEDVILYDIATGEISGQNSDTTEELVNALHLNEDGLTKARKTAMDEAFKILQLKLVKKPNTWVQSDFDAEIEKYKEKITNRNGQQAYRRFCMAVIYFLEDRKRRRPER